MHRLVVPDPPNTERINNLLFTSVSSLVRPSDTVLLAETVAPDPIAVAKERPSDPSEFAPMYVLLFPAVFVSPAPLPRAELPKPVVLLNPAAWPKNALTAPVVLNLPESRPKKEFWSPVVFANPEERPKKELAPAKLFRPESAP